ncbi:AAA-like domain-containing protein [Nodosilinea sp. LEGE 07298]|uniref:AAA-like domain-containing protein n=1 Tax=Nodosilinea sp. LEGE 07298 TaxID=2777970 RepID=UPI0019F23C93|nr:AAA-like domain-containing protein [Nodosilinea sp. LEGE 07298]MBE9112144.1 AAA-like domain-containing protein [Nodosilinea sp. LEGE 07298]
MVKNLFPNFMDGKQALSIVRQLAPGIDLTYVEEAVFLGTWEGKRYREMAIELGYEEGYLKDIGSRLWRLLSDRLGEEVTKKRLRYILTEAADQAPGATSLSPAPEGCAPGIQPTVAPQEGDTPLSRIANDLRFPGSPLPFGSPFYIVRSPLEDLCLTTLQQSGSLVRIKGPLRTGKTSLINWAMGTAQTLGMETVLLDIRQADAATLKDLDTFLRWFCWAISESLGIACEFDKYWFASAGSKLSCTALVQDWLINQVKTPIVVAIDAMHRLVDYPSIAIDFLSMLRSWYEKARVREEWQKLRLLMAYAHDLDLPLPLHQSPFNVGLHLEMPPFNRAQVLNLAHCYGLSALAESQEAEVEVLFDLLGGHPYLWQLAFYWLCSGHVSLASLVAQAPTDQGIYQEHLRYLGLMLQKDPRLVDAVRQLLTTSDAVSLPQSVVDPLMDLGLIQRNGFQVKFSCGLYRDYCSRHWGDSHPEALRPHG